MATRTSDILHRTIQPCCENRGHGVQSVNRSVRQARIILTSRNESSAPSASMVVACSCPFFLCPLLCSIRRVPELDLRLAPCQLLQAIWNGPIVGAVSDHDTYIHHPPARPRIAVMAAASAHGAPGNKRPCHIIHPPGFGNGETVGDFRCLCVRVRGRVFLAATVFLHDPQMGNL